MTSPLIDPRQLRFVTEELWPLSALLPHPRFAAHSLDTFRSVLDLSHKLALEKFAPHNRASDLNEPRLRDGRVHIIPEVKLALDAYAEAGFSALLADEDEGGLQLPYTLALLSDAMFLAANVSTSGYALLARGVANLLKTCGSPEQQHRYRQPIIEGRFLGTMCLSEPQAGSSLSDIATRAEPADDGSYRIVGQKMWISGGDHELAENIVHMVLARIPGGPAGVRGISLFVVPKFLVNDDGSLGARNDVQLAGVNHKLGQRGIVNTFLKFGEREQCVGFLVGQAHQGLTQMFHMMNEARIGVGMGAIMQGMAGYLYSLQYARERRQGRHPEQKDPASKPVALIEHADVKRMLLQQKCYCEGAFALAIYAGNLVDTQAQDADVRARRDAMLKLELLTPVIKAWSGEWCTKANDLAIQVLGGYGYTRDYPVEQYFRDNRLNPIHEGSNGIQGIDLLGRKVLMENGAALQAMLAELRATAAEAAPLAGLVEFAAALQLTANTIHDTTRALTDCIADGRVRLGLANASLYLTLVGHGLIAWVWLKQAVIAARAIDAATAGDRDFYQGKLAACQYFFRYELPLANAHAQLLSNLDNTTLEFNPDYF
ncbi:MAG: acyl-CoA dehydrogenase [Arenimonas sp.]|jgi:butyryl-CoA dehydrogenase